MARLPVSVCLIAKNEEQYIEQCLRKLLRYGMEIVVVDTGSTDRTKEIAAKYTDKLFDFAWCDDFSAARNFAVSKASNNWILTLDCDECVEELDAAKLRTCMQRYPKNVGVVEVRNVCTTVESGVSRESVQIDEVPRFYNKNYYEYRFRIHEQIVPRNADDYDRMILESFHMPVIVRHYGYDIPHEEMIRKQERNLNLLVKSIGETEGMDDYIYFQIGQSYNILGNYGKAIEAYDMCLEMNRNPEKKFMGNCLESYADCLIRAGHPEAAYRLLDMNRDYLKTTRLRYLFGRAAHMCGDDETAVGFLAGITDAADFERLGENVFDTYARILQSTVRQDSQTSSSDIRRSWQNTENSTESRSHFQERRRRDGMIEVTKINGTKLLVNTSLIETVEETPDTVITLTDGKKVIIKESRHEVKNLVKLTRQEYFKGILNVGTS